MLYWPNLWRSGRVVGFRNDGDFHVSQSLQDILLVVRWSEVGPENHLLSAIVVLDELLELWQTLGSVGTGVHYTTLEEKRLTDGML